jgi:hypothetical protein
MVGTIPKLAFAGALLAAAFSASANPQLVAGSRLPMHAPAMKAGPSIQPVVYRTTKGQKFSVYLTGYSFWDNTPPGSAEIARPVIRQRAGGSGTYHDPITIAVGHSFATGRQVLDFPAGTRFYFPGLRRYAIVEDVCGDGPSPQSGPCHIGYNGLPWVDIYVDGSRAGHGAANACMQQITGIHEVIVGPPKGYPVVSGPLTESGCSL